MNNTGIIDLSKLINLSKSQYDKDDFEISESMHVIKTVN